ncbi:MAG: hypothetical protein ACXVB1_10605 [Pseudobdellovibrionaceae bacterium]
MKVINIIDLITSCALILIFTSSCQQKTASDSLSSPTQYLYIQSGGCFAPTGLTASNASKTISRINLNTGVIDKTIADYTANLTDIPVAIAPYDDDNLYVLVENTGGRRIEILNKKTAATTNFLTNSTALSAVVRTLTFGSDGTFLVSKSSAIERFASNKARLPSSTTPFMSAPAGTCATSTNAITATAFTTAGDILYAHAFSGASLNNRIGMTTGSTSAASTCYQGVAAPTTASYPTAMIYISSMNDLLVAYSSSTLANNQIWQYTVDENAHTLTAAATASYTDTSVINGPTAMAYDSTTGYVYIANGTTGFANSIEKFSFDPTTKALTRVGTVPFSLPTVNHNCINSMYIGN